VEIVFQVSGAAGDRLFQHLRLIGPFAISGCGLRTRED
jgi:hypothetical protein